MCRNAKIKHGQKKKKLAWCFQTSVKQWQEPAWFSFGLAASSAQSKMRGPGQCWEPNPAGSGAAASSAAAPKAVLRTSYFPAREGQEIAWTLSKSLGQTQAWSSRLGVSASSDMWGWVPPQHTRQFCFGTLGYFSPPLVAHQGTLAFARRDACQGDLGFPKAPSVSVTEKNVCWWELDLIIICWPGFVIPVFLLTCSVPHVPGIMLAQVARGRWRQRGFLWHLISLALHWAKESFASFLSAVLEVAH